jgi:hypothetical protein
MSIKSKDTDMSKHSYSDRPNLIEDIDASILLLCESKESCTVSEVLQLARVNSTHISKQVVIARAKYMEFRVESVGRGFRIFDW